MCAPVSHKAAAKFLIITPVCPKIVCQTWRKIMIIHLRRIRSEPEFPVQISRDRFSGKVIRHRWAANVYLDGFDITYVPIAYQFYCLPELRPRALHASGLKYPFMFS